MGISVINAGRRNKQSGATLIVSLVILAVITVLGLASMRSSNLELKMAASARDRAVAFQRAESVLNRIETQIMADRPLYTVRDVVSTCPGDRCFKANCEGGLCFAGDFENAASTAHCKLARVGQSQVEFWKDAAIWNDASKHMTASVGKANSTATVDDVRYIVEFLCFVPRTEQVVVGANQEGETEVPLFRVTVRAEGEAARSTVMLQSTVRATRSQ